MRVFVTGATGYIGSAIVRELIGAGHEVLGLARSDAAAAVLSAIDVEVHRGDLEDLDSLRAGAAATDGVVHTANKHISETTDPAARAQVERSAVEAIGAALEGTDKPFVFTSGTLGLTPGRLSTEADTGDLQGMGALRLPTELAVIAMGMRGVRSSAVRLAPLVHGEGDLKGFIPTLIGIARAKGVSAYVGDGTNRWPAVHRLDAARLFRLAVEAAPAGSRLHATDEEGVQFRDIAEAIGRLLKLPAVSIAPDDAGDHFAFLGRLVAIDNPASSALTRDRLGWRPVQPALILDIEQGHYFTT
jgi:nucleoside-diphosphate-sugar epimerase